jgi:hypothetical protein
MDFQSFVNLMDKALSVEVMGLGFRSTRHGSWSRKIDERIDVISFQKHSSQELFCVNIGIHYSFVPKVASTELPDGDNITQSECVVMLRLTEKDLDADQWWSMEADSIYAVCGLIKSKAMSLFDRYQLDGPISSIQSDEIEAEKNALLAMQTKVSSFLLLATIHEYLGNREQSIRFAQTGIRYAGMAVGPKKALKDILKRYESLSGAL